MKLISFDTSPPRKRGSNLQLPYDIFALRGINSTLFSFVQGRPSFYAYIKGKEPSSVILSGHLDTVAPLGNWTCSPFSPIEEGGKIYGLGSSDMKGGVAILTEGMKFLKENGYKIPAQAHLSRDLTKIEEFGIIVRCSRR